MNSARTLALPGLQAPLNLHGRVALRVVLDTNAALDLWAFSDPRVQTLRQDLRDGQLDGPACLAMRQELEAVLARGVGAAHGARPAQVLAEWDRHVRLCDGGTLPPCAQGLRCRDADDQVFLELAEATQALWLLTSDRDLLSLARRAARRGLLIRRPQEWPGAAVIQGLLQG